MTRSKKKPFSWSYTSLTTFEQCPQKYKFKLDKVPGAPPGAALERGIKIHKAAEDYLNGTKSKLSADLISLATEFKKLKALKPIVEGNLAFDRKWRMTEYFGNNAWLRVKMDVRLYMEETDCLRIIDVKSGRPSPYPDQERIYIASGFAAEPAVTNASIEFWYTDHGVILPQKPILIRRVIAAQNLQREFTMRANRIEKATVFPARVNSKCSWCDWSKKKGGPCKKG